MSTYVIATGDRSWDDPWPVRFALLGLQHEHGRIVVVHGAAPGLDSVADDVCRHQGITCKRFPADWTQYGPSAGPRRNQQMLEWCLGRTKNDPERIVCVGFHNAIMSKTPRGNKRGTRDMMDRAAKAGIQTYLVTGWPW